MVTPIGNETEPGIPTPITAAGWTRINNPNMAHGVILTADQDFWVRFEQTQPAPATTGMRVWANTYYPYRNDHHWCGWDPNNTVLVPGTAPVWVRAVAAATTVFSEWRRD